MLVFFLTVFGQFGGLHSGGPLSASQASFDVKDLQLTLEIFPADKTIAGTARLSLAMIGEPTGAIELDLVESLKVSETTIDGKPRPFKRAGNKLSIGLPKVISSSVVVTVTYAGSPHEARRPPWSGGFNWSRTTADEPWIGVSCQMESGMVWFPCKGHPSDKIEGASLAITVPEPLYCAANGTLTRIEQGQGKRTFFWETRYPTSSYNISVNIADYEVTERRFESAQGGYPVFFYMLKQEQPRDRAKGDTRDFDTKKKDLMTLTMEYLDFYTRYYGAYPWAEEKFAVVHTAYLGMEHQTINSYGSRFQLKQGYDYILLHEMGHEWWGNKVTMQNWSDFWIHEGICTYTTGVYLEEEYDLDFALRYFEGLGTNITNHKPLVPEDNAGSRSHHGIDVYNKGALMLHGLRFLIGKEQVDQLLKDFAMNPQTTFNNTATTAAFISLAEEISGRELDWYFDVYLRRANLPLLTIERTEDLLRLSWDTATFSMPLEVEVDTQRQRIEFTQGKAELAVATAAEVIIDPRHWVLKKVDNESGGDRTKTVPRQRESRR